MKIFIISRGFPTPRYPQWGCFEKDQAEALVANGHEVVMLSVDTRFHLPNRKVIGIHEQYINGVHSIDFFYRPAATYIGFVRRLWSARLQFLHIFKIAVQKFGKPDILYAHYLSKSCIGVWLSRKFHIPVVGIEHWSALNRNPLPLGVKMMGSYTYPKLNCLITVSSALQQTIKAKFGIDSQVVSNIFNPIFHFRQPSTQSSTFNIVTTGSLLPIKGTDTLIRSLSILDQSFSNWHLSIIGEGKEKANLQLLSQQLGIAHKITFEGKKTKEEIASIYQDAHLYICSSHSETFGVAILEALACGIPAITTRCGGPEDFITSKNGIIVPIKDAPKMAVAIQQFINHRDQYDHAAIAADCEARFSPRVIAEQLTAIFEKTIAAYNR